MIKKHLWIVLIVSLCGFQFGYNTGVIAGAILFVSKAFSFSLSQECHAASILLIGAIIGALGGGILADHLGRRKGMQVAALFFIIGALLAVLPDTLEGFLWGRVFQGLGVGCVSVIAPMYLAEIAPSEKRGAYVTANQLCLVFGILVASGCNFLWAQEASWQKMVGFGAVPAVVQLILLFFIPETQKVSMQKAVDRSSWLTLFDPLFRRALVIGVLLSIFQQITGINAVIYFAPKIFNEVGYDAAKTAIFATLGIGIVNMVASAIALKLIDKIGRRPLLLWGTVGMVISLSFIGLALYTQSYFAQRIALVSLMTYVGFFAIGLGPIPSLIISEIYQPIIRGQAMSLAIFFSWLGNYVVAFTFLNLAQQISFAGAFFLYAAIGVLAIIFIWKMVPETKGKSLEEVERKALSR
jgi:MFS family permease